METNKDAVEGEANFYNSNGNDMHENDNINEQSSTPALDNEERADQTEINPTSSSRSHPSSSLPTSPQVSSLLSFFSTIPAF